ncbi:phage tail protein [Heyndrickxia coagulans]|uniref:distal tail protein Dit n=1 Tax=Heyndrickxia coagulans TaxID=1398 RepID=UPI000D73D475|nr:distal tail protein Dit [Heyndrickxia coagulans]AWP37766.1 phage tail protein [Heyndrickxia coagulans]QDI60079.1 phage tail protein [Heyndrickxia coagulans]
MTAIVSDTEFGFFYAGAHSREFNLKVIEIHRNIFPTVEEQTQNIPGMSGDLYLGTNVKNRTFVVDVEIVAGSHTQRIDLIHQISDWLMPVDDAEFDLIFDDEQDFTYYAHVSNITEVTRSLYKGKASITFSCSDPKGYGEYQQHDMITNPITITPDGTAECYPVFTCIPKKDVTRIAITDQDENYVYIGSDVDPDTGDSPVDLEPLVFHDYCSTMATWLSLTPDTLTFTPENGVIGGAMRSVNDALTFALDSSGNPNFGKPVANKWHGPVVKQNLNGQYQDYRVSIWLSNKQYYPRAKGKVELYLLDQDGHAIGKIGIKDNSISAKPILQVIVFNGTKYHNIVYDQGSIQKKKTTTKKIKVKNGTRTVKSKGKTKTEQLWKTLTLPGDPSTDTYTNFYGWIRFEKIGNKFTVQVMKCDSKHNPVWDKPITKTWTDTSKIYTQKLAAVAAYIAKYDIEEDTANPVVKYRNNNLALTDVCVWEIINGGNKSTTSPTVVARKGDEIKINCEDHTVYKNGAVFMENFYIGGQFLTMQGGVPKTFAFSPDLSDADWYFEYHPTTQ